jgi:hypothetical protein
MKNKCPYRIILFFYFIKMPEAEIIKCFGLSIRVRSDDEELLNEKLFENLIIVEVKHSELNVSIHSREFQEYFMKEFEYVDFDLVIDASKLSDNIKLYVASYGNIDAIPSGADVNKIRIFHFEFDERGDKARIYDNYKMCDIEPRWMIYRAIKDKDNKFIKWLISSYPDDIKENSDCLLMDAIEYDNAEAFHLIEEINPPNGTDEFLAFVAEECGRLEYAEYLRNHYQ